MLKPNSDVIDWEKFLTQWSKDVLASEKFGPLLPAEVRASGWLGYPGSAEDQIARVEARLGTTLPPSYRAFLQVTNGWRMIGLEGGELWPTEKIEWFAARRPGWVKAWTVDREQEKLEPISDAEYFVYGEEQDPVLLRVEYLHTALEISDVGDSALYLLNPQVITAKGEWEAWFFANWLPGAERYRTFEEMMLAAHDELLDVLEEDRLPSPDASQRMAPLLPDLSKELQHKTELRRQSMRPKSGEPFVPFLVQYYLGYVEAYQSVEDRVREIQDRIQDPREMHKRLGELADELESQGKKEYQEVAHVIRWFLRNYA